ncbi:uncharacterized protein LOC115398707 isoform X2 [Salarias fasciatus]|uniref:uncharacterized protein LOC115398707 isoform X2 n=1 Tax=Salarias fasciatus TaxID=181472 RepID=UPI0011769AB2|nr:uncharacterized protein LOC115398707 isoform X2 [Salarias fasciatus]
MVGQEILTFSAIAENVRRVFCNNTLIPMDSAPKCSGPPPLGGVCLCNGYAFVSAFTESQCEFEGSGGYIPPKPVYDFGSMCKLSIGEVSSGEVSSDYLIPVAIVVILAIIVLGKYSTYSSVPESLMKTSMTNLSTL